MRQNIQYIANCLHVKRELTNCHDLFKWFDTVSQLFWKWDVRIE